MQVYIAYITFACVLADFTKMYMNVYERFHYENGSTRGFAATRT